MVTMIVGGFVCSICCAIALLGLFLVHRRVEVETRQGFNEVAGIVFAVLGALYGVLLGFLTVVVWQQYDTTNQSVAQEANELVGLYHLADQDREPQRSEVQGLIRSYLSTVANQEWPLLASGQESTEARATRDALERAISRDGTVDSLKEQSLYTQTLLRFGLFSDSRRVRLTASENSLPFIFWIVLPGGGAIMIAYLYLFGLENVHVHALIVVSVTLVIVSILFTLRVLDNPFRGDIGIPPTAFRNALATLPS
jgi:hypothetical protein